MSAITSQSVCLHGNIETISLLYDMGTCQFFLSDFFFFSFRHPSLILPTNLTIMWLNWVSVKKMSMVAWWHGGGVDTGIQLEETGVFFFPQAFLILKEIYSDCWKFKN